MTFVDGNGPTSLVVHTKYIFAAAVLRIIVLELVWDNVYSCERVKDPGPHSVSRCRVLVCRSQLDGIPY